MSVSEICLPSMNSARVSGGGSAAAAHNSSRALGTPSAAGPASASPMVHAAGSSSARCPEGEPASTCPQSCLNLGRGEGSTDARRQAWACIRERTHKLNPLCGCQEGCQPREPEQRPHGGKAMGACKTPGPRGQRVPVGIASPKDLAGGQGCARESMGPASGPCCSPRRLREHWKAACTPPVHAG
jgi:hypothetical protein